MQITAEEVEHFKILSKCYKKLIFSNNFGQQFQTLIYERSDIEKIEKRNEGISCRLFCLIYLIVNIILNFCNLRYVSNHFSCFKSFHQIIT